MRPSRKIGRTSKVHLGQIAGAAEVLFAHNIPATKVPLLEQMALCDFVREGHYARYLRQTLSYYKQRRDLLHDALHAHLHGLLDVHAPEAGLRLVGWLPPDKDDRRAAS